MFPLPRAQARQHGVHALGEKDDYSGVAPCQEIAAGYRNAGGASVWTNLHTRGASSRASSQICGPRPDRRGSARTGSVDLGLFARVGLEPKLHERDDARFGAKRPHGIAHGVVAARVAAIMAQPLEQDARGVVHLRSPLGQPSHVRNQQGRSPTGSRRYGRHWLRAKQDRTVLRSASVRRAISETDLPSALSLCMYSLDPCRPLPPPSPPRAR